MLYIQRAKLLAAIGIWKHSHSMSGRLDRIAGRRNDS
jgi:hypothetical protein